MGSCGVKVEGMSSGKSPTRPRQVVIHPEDVNGFLCIERCAKSMELASLAMPFSSQHKITFQLSLQVLFKEVDENQSAE
jgi:hypothetical protein